MSRGAQQLRAQAGAEPQAGGRRGLGLGLSLLLQARELVLVAAQLLLQPVRPGMNRRQGPGMAGGRGRVWQEGGGRVWQEGRGRVWHALAARAMS